MTELSTIMSQEGRLVEWATKVTYNPNLLNDEDKEISNALDAWAKKVGQTGHDAEHLISQLIVKAITIDTVSAPTELIDAMFDNASIGEFDDYNEEQEPKNTIAVYDAVAGGNVYRSFIDHKNLAPSWVSLQAETDISLAEMRRGGYKTVANMITQIQDQLELEKVCRIIEIIDASLTTGNPGVITNAGATILEESADALALYLADVSDGDTPQMFAMNKYIQGIANFTKADTFATDTTKNQFNTTGFLKQYAGAMLTGVSGVKKLGNGKTVLPDKRVFGVAGKIGTSITKGETVALQETDINAEKIHIKVGGFTFGTLISEPDKIGKIILD